MLKYFLRLLGTGRLPEDGYRQLEPDRDLYVVESLVGSITFRNFRAPGRYSLWKRQWFLGSLAVSKSRVVAYRFRTCLVNVPFDDPRIRQIQWTVEPQNCLVLTFDAALFQPTWSGQIEIRLATEDA
ncbi:MAG: hypothetical protein HYV60_23840, partial [Planctomycetia bacterium]|nr:hypothetical protein [Planctomycetia bacterium]